MSLYTPSKRSFGKMLRAGEIAGGPVLSWGAGKFLKKRKVNAKATKMVGFNARSETRRKMNKVKKRVSRKKSIKKRVSKLEKDVGSKKSVIRFRYKYEYGANEANVNPGTYPAVPGGNTDTSFVPKNADKERCNYFCIPAFARSDEEACLNRLPNYDSTGKYNQDTDTLAGTYNISHGMKGYSKLTVKNTGSTPIEVDVYVIEMKLGGDWPLAAIQSGIQRTIATSAAPPVWYHSSLYPSHGGPNMKGKIKFLDHGKHYLQGGDTITATTKNEWKKFNTRTEPGDKVIPDFDRLWLVRYQGALVRIETTNVGHEKYTGLGVTDDTKPPVMFAETIYSVAHDATLPTYSEDINNVTATGQIATVETYGPNVVSLT